MGVRGSICSHYMITLRKKDLRAIIISTEMHAVYTTQEEDHGTRVYFINLWRQ